jgi:hypothetical protein
MHPKLLEEHSSLVRAAFREYISVVQAGFERIARQKVQGSKTLLGPFPFTAITRVQIPSGTPNHSNHPNLALSG